MNNLKLAILKNERDDAHQMWVNSCKKFKEKISYRIVDLTRDNWFEEIQNEGFDFLLAKPGGMTMPFKQLYDERIQILAKELKYNIYPSLNEILIYENKKYLSYWLKANKIPHPKTHVFYYKQEAIEYIKKIKYPIVTKTNIGASGSGVRIIRNSKDGLSYISRTFNGDGAKKRWGPDLKKGGLIKRGLHYFTHPEDIKKKLDIYKQRKSDKQTGFVIFQEFIPHDFEWRCVRIGDSYFAHKKIVKKEKASGSLIKGYENPPLKLFDFIRELTKNTNLSSVAIDLFETKDRGYLVNEIQCIFGQSDPYQMLVDEKPGRYIYKDNKWLFEEGDFNTNESYDLRLDHVLQILRNKQK